MRTLVTIADTGGFSAAAGRLHLTQSAVSMQMKALESEWGISLFDRRRRPPVLNEAGWRVVQHGRKLVEQYDMLKRTDALTIPEIAGTVRLGVVPSAANEFLPDVLTALRRDYPALVVRARSGLSQSLLSELGTNQIDAAIITEPDRLGSDLVAWTLRPEELKLYVHREMAGADVATILSQVPFLRFSKAMGIGQIIDAALRERKIEVDAIVEVDSIDAILRMVRLRLGTAILPAITATRPDQGDVIGLPLEPPLHRKLSFVTRQEFAGSPLIQVLFQTFLKDTATGR